ncbi:hypothetical protein CsSME_00014544 [Camellia sinensis var. sinensis]
MEEEKKHHHLFHHKKKEQIPEEEFKQHKSHEHLGELGAVAAGAVALYETHKGMKE